MTSSIMDTPLLILALVERRLSALSERREMKYNGPTDDMVRFQSL